ncbi:MAG: hypothetical protein AB7N71_04515 [Phycisphaerae bacterium]
MGTITTAFSALLAASREDIFSGIRENFEASPANGGLVELIIGVLILIGILVLLTRAFRGGKLENVEAADDSLPRAAAQIGLSAKQLTILQKIARNSGHRQPVAMLLTPANFRFAADQAQVRERTPELLEPLEEIAALLFDERLYPFEPMKVSIKKAPAVTKKSTSVRPGLKRM